MSAKHLTLADFVSLWQKNGWDQKTAQFLGNRILNALTDETIERELTDSGVKHEANTIPFYPDNIYLIHKLLSTALGMEVGGREKSNLYVLMAFFKKKKDMIPQVLKFVTLAFPRVFQEDGKELSVEEMEQFDFVPCEKKAVALVLSREMLLSSSDILALTRQNITSMLGGKESIVSLKMQNKMFKSIEDQTPKVSNILGAYGALGTMSTFMFGFTSTNFIKATDQVSLLSTPIETGDIENLAYAYLLALATACTATATMMIAARTFRISILLDVSDERVYDIVQGSVSFRLGLCSLVLISMLANLLAFSLYPFFLICEGDNQVYAFPITCAVIFAVSGLICFVDAGFEMYRPEASIAYK